VDPQQQGDETERDRHDHLQAPDRILQIAEFADPLQPRSRRQLYLLGNLLLRLLDRAAEVTVAHAELDGQVALLSFAIDVRRPGDELDVRNLAERDLREAVGPLRNDPQILDRFDVLPELRRQSHHDGEMAVAARLVEIAGALPADCRLDRGIDVAGREADAGGPRSVDGDLYRRLAEPGEGRKIGDAGHGGQHALDLAGGVGQRLEIVAEQLDRVLAFDAGYRFGDVVLQILREVELHPGEGSLQGVEHLRRQLVLVSAQIGGPFAHR